MAVLIDQELCTGCKMCSDVCPVDAISGDAGKPQSIDENKCVLCGQCVQMCSSFASVFDEEIEPIEKKLSDRKMLKGIKEPLFAAYYDNNIHKVVDILNDKNQFSVVQCAPAVRVAIAEDFGMDLGSLTPGKMAAALRKLGFDRVYDTNFSADLTIMEEGTELIERVTKNEKLPMFTSCCPAWVKYMEQSHPEYLDHLSTCKSPQQMAGAIFKTYGAKLDNKSAKDIASVSIMPCTCKSFESERTEMNSSGERDVDVVLTTRELAYLIKEMDIDFVNLQEENFDQPLGNYTGAGNIFGVTGGVMEAAIRTGYELITNQPIDSVDVVAVRGNKNFSESIIKVGDLELKVAVVAGLKNVEPIIEAMKNGKADYHFVEVMTCPEGCISGGGQPKVLLPKHKPMAYENRISVTYQHDSESKLRKSHENPAIKKLYKDFLKNPLGHKSHELLHTKYYSRKDK